jgi:macrolide transport system ATP-binding/permease protein
MLIAIAAGVLLIACANVANLLLGARRWPSARSGRPSPLGASRGRLVKQLIVESVLLASAGGLLGLAVSWVGATMLLKFFGDPEGPQLIIREVLTIVIIGLSVGLPAAWWLSR